MDQNFTRSVLSWYDAGHRDLPWRHTKDAYRIWISEIMLQQTRAETVVSYYERFLARYPDVYALADAPEEELLKAWEGLGYYSRARSLQKAAKLIVSQHGGELPADLEKLRALPGIGDYTSGAIASIAFGIPAAAVDGNVERVVCRYFALSEEMGSPKSRRMIHDLTQELVPPDRPGAFANAMMEMGATMCTPKSPACLLCPVRENCKGHARGIAANLPVKPRKKAQRVETRCVMLVFCQNRVLTVLRKERLLGRPFRLSGCGRGAVAFADVRGAQSAGRFRCLRRASWPRQTCLYPSDLGDGNPCLRRRKPRRCAGGRWVSADELGGPAHAYGSQGRAQIRGGYAYARQRLSVGRY